ncbi:MAG: galactose mutarotase [Planctomycetota bacterium]|nr:galactose mutarotase [Planctomycetota bacterium]
MRLLTWSLNAILIVAAVGLVGCSTGGEWIKNNEDGGPSVVGGIIVEPWGEIEGEPVQRYTLDNGQMLVRLIDYGATLTECLIPGKKDGKPVDVVLGFDDLEGYIERSPYFGCIVGRCANRIAFGKFDWGGRQFTLATNNGDHHLHGGDKGFDKRIWDSQPIVVDGGTGVEFRLVSESGEEGYPGEVRVAVRYILTNDDQIRIEMAAESSEETPVNLAHHSYWNLGGHDSGTVLDQELMLNCSRYTPALDLIPTGDVSPVKGTPLDFTRGKKIGADLNQLPKPGEPFYAGGYDHNFVVDGEQGELRLAAKASDKNTGIQMEVWSDQPGLQFYSGNFLDNVSGKSGAVYPQYGGFCLESQIWPDAIHRHTQAGWPKVILKPGDLYTHTMVHQFSPGSERR